MKKHFILCLMSCLFLGMAVACKNPLSRNQYTCKSAAIPEPPTADDYIKIATQHTMDQEYDCAYGACAEAVRLEPGNARAYGCRGQANHYRGDTAAALSDYEQALRLDPNNAFIYYGRSLVYEKQGELDRALEDTSKALQLAAKLPPPDSSVLPHWTDKRGELYFRKGDYQRAVTDYTEAIRLKPDYKYFYKDRARAYKELGQNDLAAADEAQAEQLDSAEKGGQAVGDSATAGNTEGKEGAPISGGVLNDKAVSLPEPAYPASARAAKASGRVTVRVTVDEKGDVISAQAVSGHPLLRAAAEAGARQARFKPTLINGKPVKVTGTLNYDFAAP